MQANERRTTLTQSVTWRRVAALALSLLTVLLLLLSGTLRSGLQAAPAMDVEPLGYAPYSDNWRIGFGCAREHGYVTDYDISQLCAGWYHDWGTLLDPPQPDGIEYMQLIRVSESHFDLDNPSSYNWADLDRKIAANLGSVWMIGNEPDGRAGGACDQRYPEEYARIFKIFYDHIKGEDPTAQITNGPVIQGTPIRMDWLSQVWDAYQTLYGVDMPVDIWNMHNQMVTEEPSEGADIPLGTDPALGRVYGVQDNDNIDLFVEHVVRMRQWMKDHGQQEKALIISEYGVLQPEYEGFTMDRINRFMDATFTYLLHATDPDLGMPTDGDRLVQRWAWFALNTPLGSLGTEGAWNGNLFDSDTHEITEMGRNFGEFVCSTTHATPTPDGVPAPLILREAEESTTHGNMQAGELESASKCRYVYVPEGAAGGSGDSDVTYNVRIPSSGDYYVWIRGYGIDYANKSVNLLVSGYPYEAVYFGEGAWGWRKASTTYALEGPRWATITLAPRVDGETMIDMLVITSNAGYNPASDPDLVQICNPTATPTPTRTLTPTTTPSPTITRTPMPVGEGKIAGQVSYQGRPDAPDPQLESDLMVSAHLPGDPIPAYQFDLVSSDSGEFEVATGVLPGTYDVGVRDTHSLRNIKRNVAVSADTPQLDMGELVEGDSNLDNRVSLLDYAALAPVYGTSQGDPDYDPSSDFNQDGSINIVDFSLLASNYGSEGDVEVGGALSGAPALKGSGTFSVVPANQTVSIGETFSAAVYLNTSADVFTGVDLKLYFDATYFDVVSLVPSGILNMQLANQTYADHIWYASGRLDPISGSQLICTVNLRSKAAVSNSVLDLRDAEAAYQYESLTTTASDGRVTVLANTATPTPSNTPVQTPVPSPTSTEPAGPGLGELILREDVNGYTGMVDTYIDSWRPNDNYHTAPDLKIRSQDIKRILFRADVTVLPPGTVIQEAVLTLYETSGSANGIESRVYELLTPWEPSETTWLASDNGVPWTIAGAGSVGVDRSGTLACSTEIFPTWGSYVAYGFDYDITSLVQGWVDDPSGNNGLIIYNGDGPNSEFLFGSCDHSNESIRPRLMIRYYTGPTPTPSPTVTGTPPTATPTVGPTPTVNETPQTTTLDVLEDTYINAWDPAINYGNAMSLKIRSNGVQHALVGFGLNSGAPAIPQYANILSAELQVYSKTGTSPDVDIAAYGLRRDWEEFEANWSDATAADAWGAAGASNTMTDRDPAYQDVTNVNGVGWFTWDVTSAVQSWADDPADNHGLLLIVHDGPSTYYDLASREFSSGTYGAKIVVNWLPGVPPATATPTPTQTPTTTPTPDGGIIEGHVYVDADQDMRYDLTEGVAGGQVQIRGMQNNPGFERLVTSAVNGLYRFEGLPLDTYQVQLIAAPSGYAIVDKMPVSVGAGPGYATAVQDFRVEESAGTVYLPMVMR